jgi:phosphinothricin acetyltransferase
MLSIRRASIADLAGITEIYNDAVLTTTATFDTKPKSIAEQKVWLESHGEKYPVLVAEEDGAIVGWASLSPWSDRCAYSETAEISIYISEPLRGRGIGSALMSAVLDAGRKTGLHTVLARVVDGNAASVRVHESAGFVRVGVMKEVGRKFGNLLDVILMQKILHESE